MTPGFYRHYKGDVYQFVYEATDTETGIAYMVYFNVDKPEKVWVRSLEQCSEEVIYKGHKTPRFDWLGHAWPY